MTNRGSSQYTTWANSKAEAIEKVSKLATEAGHRVTGADAERFPEGRDYRVNWRVRVYWADPA